jgi:hypothetical protein
VLGLHQEFFSIVVRLQQEFFQFGVFTPRIFSVWWVYTRNSFQCGGLTPGIPFSVVGLHQEFFSIVVCLHHEFFQCGGFTPGILFGGFEQIQLRVEGRENADLGGCGPLVRGSTQSD